MYTITIDRSDVDGTYDLPYAYGTADDAQRAALRALPLGVTLREPRTPGHGRIVYTIADATGDGDGTYVAGTVTIANDRLTTLADVMPMSAPRH